MPWVNPEVDATRHRSHTFPGGDQTHMLIRAVSLTGAAHEGNW